MNDPLNFFNEICGDPWKESIVLSSVPLWKYENGLPIANASGCLVDYHGCRFILSIAHATIAGSEWMFEIKSADKDHLGNWGVVYQPVDMQFLTAFKFERDFTEISEPKLVDFTYRKIDKKMNSYHVIIRHGDTLIGSNRTVFQAENETKPSKDKKYGFYGNVRFSGTQGNSLLFEHRLEDNLKFESENDGHYLFSLPHKYGSHANYQGCSGAPIIDEDGNLVALVSFGSRTTNCIHAVDIKKYLSTLQIEAYPIPPRK